MRHTRRNQHQAEPTPGRTNTRKINISTATLLQAKRAQDQHLQPTSSRLQHQTNGEQQRSADRLPREPEKAKANQQSQKVNNLAEDSPTTHSRGQQQSKETL